MCAVALIFFVGMLNKQPGSVIHWALKHLPLGYLETNSLEAGRNALMRRPIQIKNKEQVTTTMIRLTKLIRTSDATLHNRHNSIGNDLFLMWETFSICGFSWITIRRCSNVRYSAQQSKVVHGGKMGTTGNPKRRKSHGFGVFVVEMMTFRRKTGIKFSTKSTIINPSGGDILKELREKNSKTDFINYKLIHVIANLNILMLAYESLKSAPRNITTGAGSKNLDGLSLPYLKKISSELRAGKYEFSLARRKYIHKPNKPELIPLEIVSHRDKVVQTAILMVLETIYETTFLNSSHGFRLNKGCHTALNSLEHEFGGVKWVIEGSISKCYDSIDHDILLNLLRKRITCDKTITLIKRSLKNPFMDGGKIIIPKIGTFQGSSLSPLLCNVYLHEMDLYMETLKKTFDLGESRRKHPDYRRIQYFISRTHDTREKKNYRKLLRTLPSKLSEDNTFRRIKYVRYAGDFVIGIIGSLKDGHMIKEQLKTFLQSELKLTLNDSKTKISNFNRKGIFFLGSEIKGGKENKKVVRLSHNIKVRTTSRPRLKAPLTRLLTKAQLLGFFKRTQDGRFVPTAKKAIVNLDHSDILAFYNHKVRGILSYYSFADNMKSLGSIIHGFKHSCALTLALKYKLRRKARVFKKFGTKLNCKVTGAGFYIPTTFKRTQKFMINPKLPEEILEES